MPTLPPGPWGWGCWWALCCLALRLLPAEGFVLHLQLDCWLGAEEGRPLLWANWTLGFNKVPFLCYDAAFPGVLPCGLGASRDWIGASAALTRAFHARFPAWGRAMSRTCHRQSSSPPWGAAGARRTPPNARIYPITPQNTPAPIMLACDVWGFYPPEVGVTWLRNGAFVRNSSAVPVVSNGDWTYQTRLTLPVHPQAGDTYTCHVDHVSLREPLAQEWEPGLAPQLKVMVGVSSAVLGVGILFLISGLVCWNKQAPEGYSPIDGSNYPPVDS